MVAYQKRVEDTPKREQELFSIQRDYENLKSLYDSLLKRSWKPTSPSAWKRNRKANSSGS